MNKHKHREHPVPKPVKEVPKPKCQYCGNKFTRKYHLLIKTRYYYYLYRALGSTVARCGYLPVPKSADKCGVVAYYCTSQFPAHTNIAKITIAVMNVVL